MKQQILERATAQSPTYEMYMADIIRRGWLRYYERGILEIVQSAQRLTSPVDGRAEFHTVTPEEIQGVQVAYINSSGFVSIIHDATPDEDASVVDTILPWYLATLLTFRGLFFEFQLVRTDRVLSTSHVILDRSYFRATR